MLSCFSLIKIVFAEQFLKPYLVPLVPNVSKLECILQPFFPTQAKLLLPRQPFSNLATYKYFRLKRMYNFQSMEVDYVIFQPGMAHSLEIKAKVVADDSNFYHLLNTCLVLRRHSVKCFTHRALIATLQSRIILSILWWRKLRSQRLSNVLKIKQLGNQQGYPSV